MGCPTQAHTAFLGFSTLLKGTSAVFCLQERYQNTALSWTGTVCPAPHPAGASSSSPSTEKCWKPAGCTHIHHLLSVLVERGEVRSAAVSLGQRNHIQGQLQPQRGSGLALAKTGGLTLKYCTLKSSAPASTEELMRHRGCPPASERAQSHRHLHLLTTSSWTCDASLKQEVTALISLL